VNPVRPDAGERARPDRRPTSEWAFRVVVVAFLVCLFLVAYGAATAWHSLVTLPRGYDHLRSRGVATSAELVGCQHRGCRLRVTFAGRSREWLSAQGKRQFDGLQPGARVPVLVDPAHPSTVYTVRDVGARTNAGWSGPAIYGVVLLTIGVLGLYGLFRLARLVRRVYGRRPGAPPAGA
jgi:hypothetical protein